MDAEEHTQLTVLKRDHILARSSSIFRILHCSSATVLLKPEEVYESSLVI